MENVEKKSKFKIKSFHKRNGQLIWWLLLLPGLLLTLVFRYGPMFGITVAFQDFGLGSSGFFGNEWVGLDNFYSVFRLKGFVQSVNNTLIISSTKIILGIVFPLILALCLNEVGKKWFSKIVQTAYFLPFFLSWIILGGIINQMFSYYGIVNTLIAAFGFDKVVFLINNNWFRTIIILSDVWKGMGYNMIIFLAAISSIDPSLYEAAEIDGANRIQRVFHITLPGILPTLALIATLSLNGLLNGNFDQVVVLYNPMVYEKGDIIDTFIYRLGFKGDSKLDISAAVGLLKSVISFLLVGGTYYFAYKKFDYRIF